MMSMPGKHKENESVVNLLADLLFTLTNKDEPMPHSFGVDAVVNACEFLLEHYQGDKYSKSLFRDVLKDMLREKRLSEACK